MKPEELARMRNFLSVKNMRRIRKLLNTIDHNMATRSRTTVDIYTWYSELADELSACRAILNTWHDSKKGGVK